MVSRNEMLCWKQCVSKENHLRLQWFIHNEDRLNESATKPNAHHVTEEEAQAVLDERNKLYENSPRYPKFTTEDVTPVTEIEYRVMKPVPKELTDMIYESTKGGRVNYLHERIKTLPEDRYYCKETTSFVYGWKMWDCAKTMGGSKCGKSKIIQNSFYRRRAGIEKDPDWYTNAPRTSPTVCNCS